MFFSGEPSLQALPLASPHHREKETAYYTHENVSSEDSTNYTESKNSQRSPSTEFNKTHVMNLLTNLRYWNFTQRPSVPFEGSNGFGTTRNPSSRQKHKLIQWSLQTLKKRAGVLDAFMTLPFCSQVRSRRGVFHWPPAKAWSKAQALQLKQRNNRRKLKLFRLFKRILKPNIKTFPITNIAFRLNKKFNHELKQTLKKLYRRRIRKLRNLFFNNTWNPRPLRINQKIKKKQLKKYIRKYRLNNIFKLFRIRVVRAVVRVPQSVQQNRRIQVLCIAPKRSQNIYLKYPKSIR